MIACDENVIVQLLSPTAIAQIGKRTFGGYWPSPQLFDLEINCTSILVKFYLEMIGSCQNCCLLGWLRSS